LLSLLLLLLLLLLLSSSSSSLSLSGKMLTTFQNGRCAYVRASVVRVYCFMTSTACVEFICLKKKPY
jgi:hypothetical protein